MDRRSSGRAVAQTTVVAKLAELRRRGVVVRYLEGNRDYGIARCYTGVAVDEASDAGLVERFGGTSLFAAHGDGINPADRQYRLWRRVSRSAPVWWMFRLVPATRRARLAEALERRLRATNVGFKSHFPESAVRSWAARHLAAGHDAVVLGHFHVELDLTAAGRGRILVLPEWKGSRRHLQVRTDGSLAFVDSVY